MSHYAIGDVQGCLTTLKTLLTAIQFHPDRDVLWFAGDLINRGAHSLETLRFIKSLGSKHRIVLGNHDLHFLAVARGVHSGWPEDTFASILAAHDSDELVAWLSALPLMQYDMSLNYIMIHAGLASSWDVATAEVLSQEVSGALQGKHAQEFLQHMYGNEPNQWSHELTGWDRLRCITNFFTRARFCYADGSLELKSKGTLSHHESELTPWFKVSGRKTSEHKVVFGHWAALGGVTHTPNVYAIDTGCVWGFSLTAMRLEDGRRISVPTDPKDFISA